jgi:adenylate cyclase
MAYEIERKYLVDMTKLNMDEAVKKQRMRQGYLLNEKGRNVRVRIGGEKAYLTVKGAADGIRRLEFEYEIPVEDAEAMLGLTDGRLIEKTRYFFEVGGKTWEVDIFEGQNAGLVVAEIELEGENEAFERPLWITEDVSDDSRYLNAQLLLHPYCEW